MSVKPFIISVGEVEFLSQIRLDKSGSNFLKVCWSYIITAAKEVFCCVVSQDYVKTAKWISPKLSWRMGLGP